MVQPIDRDYDARRPHSLRIILPSVYSAVQRRCTALPCRYGGTRNEWQERHGRRRSNVKPDLDTTSNTKSKIATAKASLPRLNVRS